MESAYLMLAYEASVGGISMAVLAKSNTTF
jgi:hypothetical protein